MLLRSNPGILEPVSYNRGLLIPRLDRKIIRHELRLILVDEDGEFHGDFDQEDKATLTAVHDAVLRTIGTLAGTSPRIPFLYFGALNEGNNPLCSWHTDAGDRIVLAEGTGFMECFVGDLEFEVDDFDDAKLDRSTERALDAGLGRKLIVNTGQLTRLGPADIHRRGNFTGNRHIFSFEPNPGEGFYRCLRLSEANKH